ncbi:MAG: carboxypeptidase regulatory-like domain-containing protein, partial [Candidatus Diapherotrites archaeon]|nr:carboxypeptidase regulatory-like domain-containing protein [Candidatus Diapherotrites archaeon]
TGVEKGGVHVRIGADGVAFVESQEAGVTGFEATTSDYFYGKSYQPLPAPGNETADMQNTGIPGQENKFVELRFDKPENTIAFRVKITSSYLITKDNIELHYRAWSEAGGKIFRNPLDAELGEKMFTDTKTGLYANTINEPIQVFAAKPDCENDLCGAYFFVLPNGLYIDKQDFKAVTEEFYALEIDLSSNKPVSITLKLDTDKTAPKLQFTGYDVDEFVDQQEGELMSPETDISGQGFLEMEEVNLELQNTSNPLGFSQGGESTSLTISSLGVSPERPRKIRVYFKAIEEGSAEIKMQAIGEGILDETFIFEIERNKPLIVSITPSSPQIGQAFTVKVLDGEDGNPVQNAVVHVKNSSRELVSTVIGKESTRHGLRGEYYFRNSLDPGFYTVIVNAEGYKGEEAELVIARDGILEIRSPINISIAEQSKESSVSLAIKNTGEEEVQELEYEIEKGDDFPDEFSVSVTMPQSIGKGQDSTATIRVLVNLDEDSEESFYGEADLIIKGMVAGNYPTNSVTKLQINYNKQLEEDCLYFDTEHLMIRFIGRAGSTGMAEIEVTNNCGTALDLRGSAEARQQDPNLTVTV